MNYECRVHQFFHHADRCANDVRIFSVMYTSKVKSLLRHNLGSFILHMLNYLMLNKLMFELIFSERRETNLNIFLEGPNAIEMTDPKSGKL